MENSVTELMKDEKIVKRKNKVSIIMPSLNVVEYIDECILSALNQTLIEKEIICIDAGSTDGTWERLKVYANDDKYKDQIKLLHCDVRSYGYQVNIGISIASGDYIAILETDDYVEKDMYEYLYKIAVKNNADFAKANYDTFLTNSRNKKIFERVMLFENEEERYGKIFNPNNDLYLYINDHSIWKGIYKKEFLLKYNITLNESSGAAFQDIGFVQQVLACARRGIYCDKSFYRYRTDRGQASVKSVFGLKYSYEEFRRLLDTDELKKKFVYIKGLYTYMVKSFCIEIKKTLRSVGYNMDSEYIKPYYKWFKKQILDAIEKNILDLDIYQQYSQLVNIINDFGKYNLELESKDTIEKENMVKLLNLVKNREVIVFGLGAYGKLIIQYLFSQDINVRALCDNNKALWKTSKYGLVIYQPGKCVEEFPECMYIISSKRNGQDIFKQLIGLGIEAENIYTCI